MGLELAFFYFILSSPSLTRDVKWVRLYLDGKNMRRQCQMNTLRTTLHWVFSCAMLSGVSWATLHRFFTNVVPRVLRQHWTGFFSFSMLPRVSRTTLNKIFPVQCCHRSIKTILHMLFSPCNIVWRLLNNIGQGFYQCNVVPRETRQHWTGYFLV